jgi:ribosomal protein S8
VFHEAISNGMMDMDDKTSISPSKLNKELNKILETERMIKEYKEMITKMQRDLYSKKTETQTIKLKEKESASKSKHQSTASLIRKVFQEDVNPTELIQSMIKKN